MKIFNNEKCDIWLYGVIMYILISGSPPFFYEINTLIYGKLSFEGEEWDLISEEAKDLFKNISKDLNRRISDLVKEIYIKKRKGKFRNI